MGKNVSTIHNGDDSLIREFYQRMELWLSQARSEGIDAPSWISSCKDKHSRWMEFVVDFGVPYALAIEFRDELHRELEAIRMEKNISILHLVPQTRQVCIEILRCSGGIRDAIRIDRLFEETQEHLRRAGGFAVYQGGDETVDLLHDILALRSSRMQDILREIGKRGGLDCTTQKFLSMLKTEGDDATREMAAKAQRQIFDRIFFHPVRKSGSKDNIILFQKKQNAR